MQEQQMGVFRDENGLAAAATGHHMTDHARILESQGPHHH